MKRGCLVGGLGIVIAVCTLIVIGSMTGTRPPEHQPIEIAQSAWTLTDSGMALHTLTLKNTGRDRRRDIAIKITYRAKTGTTLASHDKTIYEFIEPGKTITVKAEDYAPRDAATASVQVEGSRE